MNRNNSEYKRRKKDWLKARQDHGGWYICEIGNEWTKEPELDHIDNTGMGGSPSRLLDENNWQLLCHDCHQKKTDNRYKKSVDKP